MNVLETFFILFKSNSGEVQTEAEKATAAADTLANHVDRVGEKITAQQHAEAALIAGRAAQIAQAHAVIAEHEGTSGGATKETAEAAAAQLAAAAKISAAKSVIAAAEEEANAVGKLTNRYKLNRMQQMELVAVARHTFDQLANGGNLFTALSTHAATLAQALGSGEGGVAGGLAAVARQVGPIAAALALPLTILAGGITAMSIAKGQVDGLLSKGKLADKLQMDVGDLDAWGKAVRNNGGDVKAAEAQLERFHDKVNEAYGNAKSQAAKALVAVGVSAKGAHGDIRQTEDALLSLADAMAKVSKPTAARSLRDLGITDEHTIQMVMLGRVELEKQLALQKANGVVTAQQVKAARDYKFAQDQLNDTLDNFKRIIAGAVLPLLTDFIKGIIEAIHWITYNKVLVQGFGVAVVGALSLVTAFIWGRYIPAWAAAAVEMVIATWPILLMAAAVAALAAAFALAWEDVQFFFKGQTSLIGELIGKYPWLAKAVHFIADGFRVLAKVAVETWKILGAGAMAFGEFLGGVFRQIWRVAGPILGLIRDLFKEAVAVGITLFRAFGAVAQEVFKILGPLVAPVLKMILAGVQAIGHAFAAVGQAIVGQWGSVFDGVVKRVNQAVALIRGLIGFIETARRGLDALVPGGGNQTATRLGVEAAQGHLQAAARNPMASTTTASVAAGHGPQGRTSTATVTVGKVEVHTQATDADGMARAASGALSKEMRQAVSQFDDGVAR